MTQRRTLLEVAQDSELSTEELLLKMLTLMRHMIRDKAWTARAIGSNHFGYGATPREAMLNALTLVDDHPEPPPAPNKRRQLL